MYIGSNYFTKAFVAPKKVSRSQSHAQFHSLFHPKIHYVPIDLEIYHSQLLCQELGQWHYLVMDIGIQPRQAFFGLPLRVDIFFLGKVPMKPAFHSAFSCWAAFNCWHLRRSTEVAFCDKAQIDLGSFTLVGRSRCTAKGSANERAQWLARDFSSAL